MAGTPAPRQAHSLRRGPSPHSAHFLNGGDPCTPPGSLATWGPIAPLRSFPEWRGPLHPARLTRYVGAHRPTPLIRDHAKRSSYLAHSIASNDLRSLPDLLLPTRPTRLGGLERCAAVSLGRNRCRRQRLVRPSCFLERLGRHLERLGHIHHCVTSNAPCGAVRGPGPPQR